MAPCKFNYKWLKEKDSTGELIGKYLKESKEDETNAFCNACNKRFSIIRGIAAINQHSNGNKHKQQVKLKYGLSQSHITESGISVNGLSLTNKACKAEIVFILASVKNSYSIESCQDIKENLLAAFPDLDCLPHFSMSPAKMRYVINHGLAPYFQKLIVDDIEGTVAHMYNRTPK